MPFLFEMVNWACSLATSRSSELLKVCFLMRLLVIFCLTALKKGGTKGQLGLQFPYWHYKNLSIDGKLVCLFEIIRILI
jgi:hypothetical protein